MGILDNINQAKKASGKLILIGGKRLSGKSSLAGTMPGKTLLVWHKTLETGYESALELAKEHGNHLDELAFETLDELATVIANVAELGYDNIYIDSLGAVAEQKIKQLNTAMEVNNLSARKKEDKITVWDVYRDLGDDIINLMITLKLLAADSGVNIVVTVAYKYDKNDSLEVDMPGQMTMGFIKKVCPTVMAIVELPNEETGEFERKLITRTSGENPARVDGWLHHRNPGQFEPNMTVVLDYFNKDKGE